jgi:hypothetical protein
MASRVTSLSFTRVVSHEDSNLCIFLLPPPPALIVVAVRASHFPRGFHSSSVVVGGGSDPISDPSAGGEEARSALPPPPHDHLLQHVHALLQPVTRDGARGLQVPLPHVAQVLQTEQRLQPGRVQSGRQILLVCQHENRDGVLGDAVAANRALADLLQLKLGLLKPVLFGGVNDKDDAVSAASVGAPERSELVLAAYVPDHEGGAEFRPHLQAK